MAVVSQLTIRHRANVSSDVSSNVALVINVSVLRLSLLVITGWLDR